MSQRGKQFAGPQGALACAQVQAVSRIKRVSTIAQGETVMVEGSPGTRVHIRGHLRMLAGPGFEWWTSNGGEAAKKRRELWKRASLVLRRGSRRGPSPTLLAASPPVTSEPWVPQRGGRPGPGSLKPPPCCLSPAGFCFVSSAWPGSGLFLRQAWDGGSDVPWSAWPPEDQCSVSRSCAAQQLPG
ncbi:hypothetical protein B0T24DRAFT_169609 [Lasiosphaeria ovina]|uniref:Uncharacterized protein n=1 Tax=Lasiosphaeria ovina TaxID=92902 RepID=A0AAE0NE22_9PEZI|nr:hypothetical protein B0T24DRAFT_169609 [Lasiosphaeria ovina]